MAKLTLRAFDSVTYPKAHRTNGPVDLIHVATIRRGQNKVACRFIINSNAIAYALVYQTKAKKDLAYARLQDLEGFYKYVCDLTNDFPSASFPDDKPYKRVAQ